MGGSFRLLNWTRWQWGCWRFYYFYSMLIQTLSLSPSFCLCLYLCLCLCLFLFLSFFFIRAWIKLTSLASMEIFDFQTTEELDGTTIAIEITNENETNQETKKQIETLRLSWFSTEGRTWKLSHTTGPRKIDKTRPNVIKRKSHYKWLIIFEKKTKKKIKKTF